MKKVFAIACISVMSLSSAWVITGCEPGQKTTDPANTTDSTQNKIKPATDTTVVGDTNHIKNPGK